MPRSRGTSRKGKPKKNERAAGMGRALQRASTGRKHTPSASTGGMAMRPGVQSTHHNSAMEGDDDKRVSVLDVNELDDFLSQAAMANREFVSERERFVVLDDSAQQATSMTVALPTAALTPTGPIVPQQQQRHISLDSITEDPSQESHAAATAAAASFAFHELSVPRRPVWDASTTPQELDRLEKESFLDWRRAIAKKEEQIVSMQQQQNSSTFSLGVTPFEKNLEIWRQLWRVMERSACIVQVVDARNPLFYLSQDLRTYATHELNRPMLLLINKSDYLTAAQRQAWHEYLIHADHCWEHVFFSAHDEQAVLDEASSAAKDHDDEEVKEVSPDEQSSKEGKEQKEKENEEEARAIDLDDVGVETPLSREALLTWLLSYAKQNNCQVDPKYDRFPFGMVGFPNVGKSSVINVLMGNAKHTHGVVRVGVAAQPGKTKHFQTLLLPDRKNMLLCDCPGLVFPSFVSNTADLIAAGVYPIAQMRDPWPVVNLLCRRIPREVLNAQYGIQIPMPTADAMLNARDGIIPPPTADEFLTTYCVARSMLASASGVPDIQRASRAVVKEYASGKLLYCHSPPTADDTEYQRGTLTSAMKRTQKLVALAEKEQLAETKQTESGDNVNAARDLEEEDEIMFDELMGDLDLSSSSPHDASSGSANNKKPDRKKRWGKKGRKIRNKDPYGCHSNPDESILEASGGKSSLPVGLSVKAGKYGKKGYVRPLGYGSARSAVA